MRYVHYVNMKSLVMNRETKIMLDILASVEADGMITQRAFAEMLKSSLGLINKHFQECIQTGLITAEKKGHQKYYYTLTDEGRELKNNLIHNYLYLAFDFFRNIKEQYASVFQKCEALNFHNLALVGTSELATIATLFSKVYNVRVQDILNLEFLQNDPEDGQSVLKKYDAFIITDMNNPQETYNFLCKYIAPQYIFAPEALYVSLKLPQEQMGLRKIV
jgi:predicted transcriptional regulator